MSSPDSPGLGNVADTQHVQRHATGGGDQLTPAAIGAVATTLTVSAGAGISGGGALSANRTIAVNSTIPMVIGDGSSTIPNRPAHLGPVFWKTSSTPPSGGTTSGGTAQAVAGLDLWIGTA